MISSSSEGEFSSSLSNLMKLFLLLFIKKLIERRKAVIKIKKRNKRCNNKAKNITEQI